MAISIADSEDPVSSGGAQTITQSHVITSGDVVIAYVQVLAAANPTATLDGSAMTTLGTTGTYWFGTRKFRVFIAVAASTGTLNVVMDYGSVETFYGGSFVVTGATASTTPDAITTGETDSGATTGGTTLASVADNAWMFLLGGAVNEVPSAGTGSTIIGATAVGIGAFRNGPITPAGSTAMAYTVASTGVGWIQFSLSPSGGGGGGGANHNSLTLLGVG